MSKEATVIVLHTGASMAAPFADGATGTGATTGAESGSAARPPAPPTRFAVAHAALDKWVEHKIMFGGQDEVGVVLYGTPATSHQLDEDDLQHVTVFCQVERPSLAMLKNISTLPRPAADDPHAAQGDLEAALVVAVDLLHARTKNKKFQRQVMVVTDCGGADSGVDDDTLARMVQTATDLGCKIQVMALDLLVKSESSSSSSSSSHEARAARLRNLTDLVVDRLHGAVAKPGSAAELMGVVPRRKRAKVAKYRKTLALTKGFEIDVVVFSLTSEERLPSAKRSSKLAPEGAPDQPKREIVHKSRTKNVDAEVEPQNIIKAYAYGKELVPFAKADEDSLKFKSTACLELIGFVPRDKINRAQFLAGADVVLPTAGDPRAATGMSAMVRAMRATQCLALARFVKRDAQGPLLVCLSPHVELDPRGRLLECMIANQLPFSEDLRPFRFKNLADTSVAPVSQAQLEAADALITSMDMSIARSDGGEAMSPERTYNPTLQFFYQCLSQRARDKDVAVVSGVGIPTSSSLSPSSSSSSSSSPSSSSAVVPDGPPKLQVPAGCFGGKEVAALAAFKAAFPTVKQDSTTGKKRHWGANRTEAEEAALQANTMAGGGGGGGGGSSDTNKRQRVVVANATVKPQTAAADFAEVVAKASTTGHMPPVKQAMAEIRDILETASFDVDGEGAPGVDVPALIGALRQGCITVFETDWFNSWIKTFRSRCAAEKRLAQWSAVVASRHGLISTNDSLDPSAGCAPELAAEFLSAPLLADIGAPSASAARAAVAPLEDDMDLDDLE